MTSGCVYFFGQYIMDIMDILNDVNFCFKSSEMFQTEILTQFLVQRMQSELMRIFPAFSVFILDFLGHF